MFYCVCIQVKEIVRDKAAAVRYCGQFTCLLSSLTAEYHQKFQLSHPYI